MKRTLSLVLALVMVLGSFTTVFAATEAEETAAGILAGLGVLQGDNDGDLMLDKDLERRDAVVLLSRLLGVEDEAAETEAEDYPTWADVDTDAYYLGYFAWAEMNGYFEGDDEGNFRPRDIMTAQDYALVLLRALGYDVTGHEAWSVSLETAKAAGILVDLDLDNKDVVSRGLMAAMVLNTLNANVKDSEETLAEKLGLVLPVPAELEVVSVTADNLKEVEVVFNQEVDVETVVNANVQVKGQKGSVVLKDDGVTAVITLDGKLDNQKEYTAVIDKVKAITGVEIAKTEIKFTAFDATVPQALEVTVTGPRQFTVEFSEPVVEGNGKVVVKQDNVTLGNSIKIDGNKAHVTAFTNFVEGKEYTVTVTEFVDHAGYKNVLNVLTFTYEKDATPPVATVEKVEQTYVVVSFNKPVKGLTKADFYHTFTAWTAIEIYKDAAMKEADKVSSSDSVDKVYVQFYDEGENKDTERAIPAGSTVFGINGKNIKDNWGNALGNQEFTISATSDRTAPEVVSIEVKENNELKITFSKEVRFERKNIEILDAEGKKISGLYISNPTPAKGKEFTVKYNTDLAGKNITVSIKDVEDTTLFKNVLALYTEVISVQDTKRPAVKDVYVKKSVDADGVHSAEITVQFNKKVDAATALDIANYSVVNKDADKVYMLAGNAEFDALDTRVKLTLTAAKAKELVAQLTTSNYLQVINVKDLSGNVIAPVLKQMATEDATTPVSYTVKATGTTKLVVEFDALLANISASNFAVGSDVYGASDITFTQVDGDTKTTLTFDLPSAKKMDTDAGNAVFGMKADGIKDVFGKAIVLSWNGEIKDEIKPVVAKYDADNAEAGIKKGDLKVVRVNNNLVTIEFSEDMDPLTFSTGSFKVEGRKVLSVTFDEAANKAELTLENKAVTEGAYAAVSYELDVRDEKGNALNLDKGVFAEIQYPVVED